MATHVIKSGRIGFSRKKKIYVIGNFKSLLSSEVAIHLMFQPFSEKISGKEISKLYPAKLEKIIVQNLRSNLLN
ncbi:MAG: hypothetical protein ACJAW3_001296 [Lentimonas sp.]|jgi:hypothetical protein